MDIKVQVTGMKELEKELDRVAREMKDALCLGTEEAARAVGEIVRLRAPGSIKRAVRTKPLPRKDKYPEVTLVGIDYHQAPHAHLVEFGTGPRYHASGKYVGQMPAQPFFRESIDMARGAVAGQIKRRARGPLDKRKR